MLRIRKSKIMEQFLQCIGWLHADISHEFHAKTVILFPCFAEVSLIQQDTELDICGVFIIGINLESFLCGSQTFRVIPFLESSLNIRMHQSEILIFQPVSFHHYHIVQLAAAAEIVVRQEVSAEHVQNRLDHIACGVLRGVACRPVRIIRPIRACGVL